MSNPAEEAVAELREALGLAVDEDGNSQDLLTVFRSDVETLIAAYDAREADSQRLDWIIANTKSPDWDRDWPMIYKLPALNATDRAANRHSHPTVRDAIDAAMSSEHPTPL